jgi:hypothetical protein
MVKKVYKKRGRIDPVPKDVMRHIRRACWAVRAAGLRLPDTEWFLWKDLEYTSSKGRMSLFGYCEYPKKSRPWPRIHLRQDDAISDTVIHELAHAVTNMCEKSYVWKKGRQCEVDHSPVWAAIYGRIYYHYVCDKGGPKK